MSYIFYDSHCYYIQKLDFFKPEFCAFLFRKIKTKEYTKNPNWEVTRVISLDEINQLVYWDWRSDYLFNHEIFPSKLNCLEAPISEAPKFSSQQKALDALIHQVWLQMDKLDEVDKQRLSNNIDRIRQCLYPKWAGKTTEELQSFLSESLLNLTTEEYKKYGKAFVENACLELAKKLAGVVDNQEEEIDG